MSLHFLFGRLLVIYQMPKTGSQTVEATLQQLSLPHPLLRFHYLSSLMAEEIKRGPENNPSPEVWPERVREQLASMARIRRILKARKLLRACGVGIPKLQIITGVREVIGLALSSIFENHPFFFPDLDSATVARCSEVLQRPRAVKFLQNWFDLELKTTTGIDLYQKPFPQEAGYQIHEDRFARLLLYRFEDFARLPEMLAEFLGVKSPPLAERNLGTAKAYSAQYQLVRDHLKLPPSFVAAQYASKMMRHFYSQQERERFQQRWTQKSDAGGTTEPAHALTLPG